MDGKGAGNYESQCPDPKIDPGVSRLPDDTWNASGSPNGAAGNQPCVEGGVVEMAKRKVTPEDLSGSPLLPEVPAIAPPTEAEKLEKLRSLVVARLIERLESGKKVIGTDLTNAVSLLRKAGVLEPEGGAPPEPDDGAAPQEPDGWNRLGIEGRIDPTLDLPFPIVDFPPPDAG
jgi:hypothetical protein